MSSAPRRPTGARASGRSRSRPRTRRAGHLAIIEELTGAVTCGEIVFTGGAAKGRLWPQIVADVLGVQVRVPEVKESTALGAAMYAGIGAGLYDDLGEVVGRLVRFERTYTPDPVDWAAYDEHFERWSKLYPRQLSTRRGRAAAPHVVAGGGRRMTAEHRSIERTNRCLKPTASIPSSSTRTCRNAPSSSS